MKKLFTLGLSALMLLGAAGCGSKDSGPATWHAVGGWGEWNATDNNKMTEISADDAKALGVNLDGKSVEACYKYDLTVGTADVDYTANAMKDGKKVTLNGKYKIKVIIASWDSDEETYNHDHWITNPADTDPGNAESLDGNIFFPHYAKEADANGFSWADDPVIISGEGNYTFVCVKYTAVSSASVVGYGFALIKK